MSEPNPDNAHGESLPRHDESRADRSSSEPLHPLPATPLEDRSEKRARSDLGLRLVTAAILIPLVLYVIAIGGLAFLATVLAFGLLAQSEFYRMIEDKGARPLVGVGLCFGAAVIYVAYIGNEYQAMLLMTLSLLVFMVAQLRKAQITEALASISGTFFGVFYVSWLLSHAVLLRFFAHASGYDEGQLARLRISEDTGVFFMVYTLVVVVACDAGAYFAGRAWGRHKLAPEISPNKSVEGAVGGIFGGTLFGLLAKALFDMVWPEQSAAFPWALSVPYGIVLCIVGITGDLVESLLKRDADVKDTGALLPGMGGVLDRIDAPLLALPVMYYMMLGYGYFALA